MTLNGKFDFFLSYSHDSLVTVQKLVEKLRKSTNNTVRIWIDYEQLNRHDNLQSQIKNAIRNSKCALCFISTDYLNSVMGELQLEASKEIPRVILMLEKFDQPSDEIKGLLNNEFCLDFTDNSGNDLWSGKNFEQLQELMFPFIVQFADEKSANKAYNKSDIFQLSSQIHQTIATYNRPIELQNDSFTPAGKNESTIKKKPNNKSPPNAYLIATKFFNASIKSDPLNANSYNNKGTLAYTNSRFLEALCAYNRAIDLEPKYSKAYNNKGAIFYSLNRLNEAVKCFDIALGIDPRNKAASVNKQLTIEKSLKPEEKPRPKPIPTAVNKNK